VILHLDSELVGKQLLGKYKIKEENLQKLFIKFWNLKIDFPNLEIKIIPREENKIADKLVKSILFVKKLF
jgi:ribonuclease HI